MLRSQAGRDLQSRPDHSGTHGDMAETLRTGLQIPSGLPLIPSGLPLIPSGLPLIPSGLPLIPSGLPLMFTFLMLYSENTPLLQSLGFR